MIATFKYPLPDELFVEGVSGKVEGTFTYDGPEKITVFINNFGQIVDIEPSITLDVDSNLIKEIDPKEDLPAAYMLSHYFVDELLYEYEFEDVEMENGDIHKKMVNPNLTDAYELIYDFENQKWNLKQIVKEQLDLAVPFATERKNYILKYSKNYAFSDNIEEKIEQYLNLLEDIIKNPQPIKSWKYINVPMREIPKIPAEIASEFSKIPNIEE